MPESWESKKMRWLFRLFPVYRGTGATVTYIDSTFQELRIKLPLSWKTRNYVGTIYGGVMYSSIDPMYMLMLMRILGKDYIVWDKAASIKFRRPGNTTLYATFIISDEEIAEIKAEAAANGEMDKHFSLHLTDKEGKIYAEIDKTIYVATKQYYKDKLAARGAKL